MLQRKTFYIFFSIPLIKYDKTIKCKCMSKFHVLTSVEKVLVYSVNLKSDKWSTMSNSDTIYQGIGFHFQVSLALGARL